MAEAKPDPTQDYPVYCLDKKGNLAQSSILLTPAQAMLLNLRPVENASSQPGDSDVLEQRLANLRISDQLETADLTPLHEGELPILVKFLDAATSDFASNKWQGLIAAFGKYKVLDTKTAKFITYGYSSVGRLVSVLKLQNLAERFDLQISLLRAEIGDRFKVLMLHDIGGTLCWREKELPKGPNGETNPNFQMQRGRYVYLRPGALDYVRRIQAHPRAIFGLYSSMKRDNIIEVSSIISQQGGIGEVEIFDQDFCTPIDENPRLRPLQENHWDTYRDLNKVVQSESCREREISLANICVIDSDLPKVQSCLQNAILAKSYTVKDVLGLPNATDELVRDDAWQEAYMRELGDLVIEMLDTSDDVPAYLASSALPEDHRPRDLLSEIQARRAEQEEIKTMLESQIDYNQYLTTLPEGTKFLRFKTLPKDIVYQFLVKDLPFSLERDDSFLNRGKPTYKFAIGNYGELGYLKRLISQRGWQKFGPCYSLD